MHQPGGAEWQFPGNDEFEVTLEMLACWKENGYIILRGFLPLEEQKKVRGAVEDPNGLRRWLFGIDDKDGRSTGMVLWSRPGNDVTGILTRTKKMVDLNTKLLGGEVFHYHSKMVMKSPRTGGEFMWHQDYGYWYQNGFLFPDMNTCFLAIDKADKENGCLEIIPGSHRAGRIEHSLVGGQTAADIERVQFLQKSLPSRLVALDPGDLLVFHSNILHRSAPNMSDRRRWALLMCYCTKANASVQEHHCSSFSPLEMVNNGELMMCTNITELDDKEFMDPTKDKTIRANQDIKDEI